MQKHAQVTLATIVYIPFLSGYYAEALDVLRLCLASMKTHADAPCELMVFDNGSCAEVTAFLLEEFKQGRIEYLLLSNENLGKAGAWNILFEAAPGEIIAFCDSDIYFKPGWLTPHLRLIEAFPRVGMVTGLPIRQQVNVFTKRGLDRAKKEPAIQFETGQFIGRELMEAYCNGINRNFLDYMREVAEMDDIRLTIGKESAYLGACHFQFVAHKAVLKTLLPLEAKILLDGSAAKEGSESELDKRVESNELLRLSTLNAWVHHLGNTLAPEWVEKFEKLIGQQRSVAVGRDTRGPGKLSNRIVQNRYVRGVLMRVYHAIFKLYNAPKSGN